MPGDEFVALVSTAAQTIVAAAATDAWAKARQGFGRLLGMGDPRRTSQAEERLEATRTELVAAPPAERAAQAARQAAAWETRLADALDDDPGRAAELRGLVSEIRALVPAGTGTAQGHGVVAGHDAVIAAASGGVAAGSIEGNVQTGNPTRPGAAS
jgi:hypothetical protein